MPNEFGLKTKGHPTLNTVQENSIVALDKFFVQCKQLSYVTSGERSPWSQINVISEYMYKKESAFTHEEVDKFLEWSDDMSSTGLIISPLWVKDAFALDSIFWWQIAWSILLNCGVLINPPYSAVCLYHSIRSNGTDRWGTKIPPSEHIQRPCRVFDISGGANGTPNDEYAILKLAQKNGIGNIASLTFERENNCIHVKIKG